MIFYMLLNGIAFVSHCKVFVDYSFYYVYQETPVYAIDCSLDGSLILVLA